MGQTDLDEFLLELEGVKEMENIICHIQRQLKDVKERKTQATR